MSERSAAEAMREMAAREAESDIGRELWQVVNAIRALPLPSQPEDSSARGVVVPREPTEEMLKAGYTRLTLREKYKAMLAAAQQQNAAQKDQSAER